MIISDRPSIDKTQMDTARLWAKRSTCDRMHVGAVLSLDGRTIGTGYNGAPAGMAHCNHEVPLAMLGLPRIRPEGGCQMAIHAETNAIAYAARHGVAVAGADIYVTLSPCFSCAQLLIAAGLRRVVYDRAYRDPTGLNLLIEAGLTVEKWIE